MDQGNAPNLQAENANLRALVKQQEAEITHLTSFVEQQTAEIRVLTANVESLNQKVLGFLKSQDKDGTLTKRITPNPFNN
jgi:hypothetical protein